MIKAAVLLAGCGHLDGSEIRESIITLLELDKNNVHTQCFSHNQQQKTVVNHIQNSESSTDIRNILVESSRIARGNILDFSELDVVNFDMLLMPGGYGIVRNFSNILQNEPEIKILSELKRIIIEFYLQKKSIGAICIAPALVVASLKDYAQIEVTIGEDSGNIIQKLGGIHKNCPTNKSVEDSDNNIFSCSAYMRNERLYTIYIGIEDMISKMIKRNT